MVLLAFLCFNSALGIIYGSFGPLLVTTEEHFGISRAEASTGLSMWSLAFGLCAPLGGSAVERFSVRKVMLCGAILNAVGYIGLAIAPFFALTFPMFILIGAGCILLSGPPAFTLISRWFIAGRARALAVMTLPIFMFTFPYIISQALPIIGRSMIYIGLGILFIILMPAIFFIVDRPEHAGQQARLHEETSSKTRGQSTDIDVPTLTSRQILLNRDFWVLYAAVVIMFDSGTIYLVHIVPFGITRGMPLQDASVLISLFSASGIIGNLLFGWMADRIGPAAALAINAATQGILWCATLYVSEAALYMVSALMGLCCVSMVMLNGAAHATIFGTANVGKAMGFNYLLRMPVIFIGAPLVGYAYDKTKHYDVPFIVLSTLLALSCGAFVPLIRRERKRRASQINRLDNA